MRNKATIYALLVILLILGGVSRCNASSEQPDQRALRMEFDTRYQAWKTALEEWIEKHPSSSATAIVPEAWAVIAMGPRITPFFIEILEKDLKSNLFKDKNQVHSQISFILRRITGKRFPRDEVFLLSQKYIGHKAEEKLYVDWWRQRRRLTPQKFDDLYTRLIQIPKEEQYGDEWQDIFTKISDLGIEALPLWVRKIEQGDERYLKMVRSLLDVAGVKADAFVVNGEGTWSAETMLKWWKVNKEKVALPDPPPGPKTLRTEFETRYWAWIYALREWMGKHSMSSATAILPEEINIVNMGPIVIPFIIEILDKDKQANIFGNQNQLRSRVLGMLHMITAKQFAKGEWPTDQEYGSLTVMEGMYINWWRNERKLTPQKFNEMYAQLNQLPRDAQYDARSQEILDKIRGLGIEALPLIIEKIRKGDNRLLPAIRIMIRFAGVQDDAFVVDGKDTWSAKTLLKWWKTYKERLTYPDPEMNSGKD